MTEGNIPPHQCIPYGRIHQTEHFVIQIRRCRICNEFLGCETAVRTDVPPEAITETETKNEQSS